MAFLYLRQLFDMSLPVIVNAPADVATIKGLQSSGYVKAGFHFGADGNHQAEVLAITHAGEAILKALEQHSRFHARGETVAGAAHR